MEAIDDDVLSGFLDDCDAFLASTELLPIVNHTEDILLDNDPLLTETEILLASYENSDNSRAITSQDPTVEENFTLKPQKTPMEIRKEVKNALAAKRRLKYRNKLKNERQTLQEQEKNLSEELSQLQHLRKKTKLIQQKSRAIPMWKNITKRQMEGRLEAEEKQKVLKQSLDVRSRTILEIEKMIRQHLYCSNNPMISAGVEEEKTGELNMDDKVLFEDYLRDLDEIYARTNEVFQDSGAEENPVTSYRIGPEWRRDGDLEFIENLDVLFVPFSFEQTCTALWQSMVLVHQQQDRQHYNGVHDPENTIAVKFHLQCPREMGGSIGMLVHFVMRRYVEAERMVLVWRALSEGEAAFSGLHSDETGWCVVRPNDSGENVDSLMQTVMETFVRFIPMSITTKHSNKVHTEQFSELVISSIDVDAAEISRMMSSLLIDDSLGKNVVVQTTPGIP